VGVMDVDEEDNERRKSHARTLVKALREITTDEEFVSLIIAERGNTLPNQAINSAQEAPMAADEKKMSATRSGVARSAKAAKLGLTMAGVDRVGKGAMSIAKQPFEVGSKTREFLETDEGRHLVLGGLAFLANIAAELESVPVEANNIEWVTEAQIANSVMGLTNAAVDASTDKLIAAGMQLYQFVLGLKEPQSMADIIEMTRGALGVEDAILDTSEAKTETAEAPSKARAKGGK